MTKKVWCYFTPEMLAAMDKLCVEKGYANKPEIIRIAVLDLLKKEAMWTLEAVSGRANSAKREG